jgi:hypothetical protein
MKSKKCNTRRYEILHTLNMGCSVITPSNNKRPRCDIAWPHITNQLCYGCLTYNTENRDRNITYNIYSRVTNLKMFHQTQYYLFFVCSFCEIDTSCNKIILTTSLYLHWSIKGIQAVRIEFVCLY